MRRVTNDPAARTASREGAQICFIEGEKRNLNRRFHGARRFWIHLALDGQLIITTRMQLYTNPGSYPQPSPPAVSCFAPEAEILDYLRRQGLSLPPLRAMTRHYTFRFPRGLEGLVARPFSEWSQPERAQVAAYMAETTAR